MSITTLIKVIQDIMRKDVGVDGDAQRISQICWLLFLKIFDDKETEWELTRRAYKSPLPPRFRWRNWAKDPEGDTGEDLIGFVNNHLFPELKQLASKAGVSPEGKVVGSVFEDAYNYMKSGTLLRQVINTIEADVDFNSSKDRHLFNDIYEKILADLQSAGNAGEYYTPRAVTQFMVDILKPQLGEKILDPACGTGGFLICCIEALKKQAKTAEDLAELQKCIHGVEKKPLPHMLAITNMLLHGIDVPTNILHDNTLSRPYKDYGPRDRVDIIVTNPPFGGMEEDGIEKNFLAKHQTRETADLFMALIMHLLKHDTGRAAVVLPDGFLFGEGVKTTLKKQLLEEFNLHTIVRLPKGVFSPYTSINTNLLFFEKGGPTKTVWFFEHPYPDGYKSYSRSKPLTIEEFDLEKKWWGGTERRGRKTSEYAWKVSAAEIAEKGYNLDLVGKNPHQVEVDHGNPEDLMVECQQIAQDLERAQGALKAELITALTATSGSTIAQLLEEYFDVAFTAPGAIAKLRELILSFAIQGKLSPHRSAGAPTKTVFLREVTTKIGSGSTPPGGKESYVTSGIPLIRSMNVHFGGFKTDGLAFITQEQADKLSNVVVHEKDVLLNITGASIGRVTIAPPEMEGARVNQHVCIVRPNSEVVPRYLEKYLASPLVQQLISEIQVGATREALTKAMIEQFSIVLPPKEEQIDVVTKIDEFMAKCDALDGLRLQRDAKQGALLYALLAQIEEYRCV